MKNLINSKLGSLTIVFLAFLINESFAGPTFKTVNGEVVMEAESYTRLGGSRGAWKLETATPGYLGKGYMLGHNGGYSSTWVPNLAQLAFEIDFIETGKYYVHFRTWASDHENNGFHATLDGQKIEYVKCIYVRKYSLWSWYTADDEYHPVTFTVGQPGKHIFAVEKREDGTKIDHIWLTKNVPSPKNASSITLPNLSNFIVSDVSIEHSEKKLYVPSYGNIIQVSPNPVSITTTIKLLPFIYPELLNPVQLTIYDAVGKIIYRKNADPNRFIEGIRWNTLKYSPGAYIISMKNGERILSKIFYVLK